MLNRYYFKRDVSLDKFISFLKENTILEDNYLDKLKEKLLNVNDF